MSEDEVKAAIAAAIEETGAAGMKDMGKVIAALKGKFAGKMDFAKASAPRQRHAHGLTADKGPGRCCRQPRIS